MMCFQLRDALKIGNIALYQDFFSTQMNTTEAIRQIRDELARFSIVTEPAKTLFGKVCVCLSTLWMQCAKFTAHITDSQNVHG